MSFIYSLSLSLFLSLSLCVCVCVSMVSLPVYVTPQFTFAQGTGKFNIKLGPKQTMGKTVSLNVLPVAGTTQCSCCFLLLLLCDQVEDVKVIIPMPKCVTNVNPTCTCKLVTPTS